MLVISDSAHKSTCEPIYPAQVDAQRKPWPIDIQDDAQGHLRLAGLINEVFRLRESYLDREMKTIGLTHSQCSVLLALSSTGNVSFIQSRLALALGLGKSTLVGSLDRLERKGHIERRADAADRRIKHVVLTDSGYASISKIQEMISATNARIFMDIPAIDLRGWEKLLSNVKTQLIHLSSPKKRDDHVPGGATIAPAHRLSGSHRKGVFALSETA